MAHEYKASTWYAVIVSLLVWLLLFIFMDYLVVQAVISIIYIVVLLKMLIFKAKFGKEGIFVHGYLLNPKKHYFIDYKEIKKVFIRDHLITIGLYTIMVEFEREDDTFKWPRINSGVLGVYEPYLSFPFVSKGYLDDIKKELAKHSNAPIYSIGFGQPRNKYQEKNTLKVLVYVVAAILILSLLIYLLQLLGLS